MIMHHYRRKRLNDWIDHDNHNCRATDQSGSGRLVYANWLHNQGLDQWKGWTCMSGARRVYIDKHLEVWNGECMTNHLGSVRNGFELVSSTLCPRDTCTGCTDDLMVAKHK